MHDLQVYNVDVRGLRGLRHLLLICTKLRRKSPFIAYHLSVVGVPTNEWPSAAVRVFVYNACHSYSVSISYMYHLFFEASSQPVAVYMCMYERTVGNVHVQRV